MVLKDKKQVTMTLNNSFSRLGVGEGVKEKTELPNLVFEKNFSFRFLTRKD